MLHWLSNNGQSFVDFRGDQKLMGKKETSFTQPCEPCCSHFNLQHLATSTTSLTNFTTKPQAPAIAWQKFNLKRFPSLWIFFMFPASDRTEACHSLGGLYSQILWSPNKGIEKKKKTRRKMKNKKEPINRTAQWLLLETHFWLLLVKPNDLFSK